MPDTPPTSAASTYPHLRQPRNRLLRLIWWAGQTGEYYHAVCDEHHVPGPCLDGVDRNPPKLRTALRIVDFPPLVALMRLGGVVIIGYVIWAVIT